MDIKKLAESLKGLEAGIDYSKMNVYALLVHDDKPEPHLSICMTDTQESAVAFTAAREAANKEGNSKVGLSIVTWIPVTALEDTYRAAKMAELMEEVGVTETISTDARGADWYGNPLSDIEKQIKGGKPKKPEMDKTRGALMDMLIASKDKDKLLKYQSHFNDKEYKYIKDRIDHEN